jgi:hypothetical protein
MNLKNKPPIFVPVRFRREIEQLSKAALMDIAWNLASQACGECDDPEATMKQLRHEAEVVLDYRNKQPPTPERTR